jgi:hypothetical protein
MSAQAPEFSLLCLAARPAMDENLEALRRAIVPTINWSAVIEGARRNRVTSLVLDSLQRCGSSQIPPDVLGKLHRHIVESVARCLAQISDLERLCTALDAANVRFLIVKGIPLSVQLYDDPCRRTADDIDVLVPPDQFWRADAALLQSGYRHETKPPSAARLASYQQWVKHVRYINEPSQNVVELHHRLTGNPYLLEWPFDEVWRDRSIVRVGGTEVATLPSAKLPLYLLAHGANHGWERLRWLVDLTVALQGPDGAENLLSEAERIGLGPATLQALLLAHKRLGFPLAARCLDQARRSGQVKLLDFCLRHFLGATMWRRRPRMKSWEWLWRFSIWFFLYGLLLKADWRYRAHHLAAIWTYPPDWNIVRLPAGLFWLYPLIRPFGWMMRRLQR